MCSSLGEDAGDVLAVLAALPHATARKSTAASEPIDGKAFMQAMLANLCDGTVTGESSYRCRTAKPTSGKEKRNGKDCCQ
jgi:hypothetical protein